MIDAVLVPSSLTVDTADPKIRTYKVGQVARALAMHRIGEVVIYPDPDRRDDVFIETLLRYAETPPYLRKLLFGKRDELAYAGVLPPLNIPHHQAGGTPRVGDVREGCATEHGVEIGADRPAEAIGDVGEDRVTVEIVGREGGRFLVAPRRGPPPAYWGYTVRRAESLLDGIGSYGTVVATSRTGDPAPAVDPDPPVAAAFGAPDKGLEALLEGESADRDAIPTWFNALPDQGTASIRTEEALYLALGPLRKLLVEGSP